MTFVSSATRLVTLVFVVGATTVACAASAPHPDLAPAQSACDVDRGAATREVVAAIDAHLACSEDADCVLVGVAVGSCFDSCSTAVNRGGLPAISDAKEHVAKTSCAAFQRDKCQLIVPPCMAPMPPKCSSGKCV